MTFSNNVDEIVLTCSNGEVDRVEYDGGTTFPDPTGESMNLDPPAFDSASNNLGANWCTPSSTFGDGDFGTPGEDNDDC